MNSPAQKPFETRPSISDDNEEAVSVDLLRANHHIQKENSVRVTQIVDQNKPLREIDKATCSGLTVTFCNYSYDLARGMMTMHILSAVHSEAAT